MENVEKDLYFRETSVTRFLSGGFTRFLIRLAESYTTFYLAFIPTGCLRSWISDTIAENRRLASIFAGLRNYGDANDWLLYTTIVCIGLWTVKIVLCILNWLLVDKPRRKICEAQQQKIGQLQDNLSNAGNELATLRQGVSDGFHRFLAHLSEYLNCGSQERISLYVIRSAEGCGEVELMQRYSVNGELGRLGRSKYKISEGVIGRAWKNGSCYYTNLPEPGRDAKSYRKVQKEAFGYSDEVIKKFSMNARTYFAFKISHKDDCPGFIVIESLANKFSSESALREQLEKNNDFLHFMLSTFRSKVPTFERAMKEDF